MSLVNRVATVVEKRALNETQWLLQMLQGPRSHSGAFVSVDNAMGNSAVFDAVRIVSESIGMMPLFLYKQSAAGGKSKDTNHPVYALLHDQPNPFMTSQTLRETLTGHLLTWGNAYAEIQRDGGLRPVALWPLRPDHMQVSLDIDKATGQPRLRYLYDTPDGSQVGMYPSSVMHVKGFSKDGVKGYSVVGLAREAIGLALATEEFGARFFGNGAAPGGVLQHPGKLTDDGAKRLALSWEEAHKGLTNSHRVAVLEEGVTWTKIGIPPEDAQFLATRLFQIEEIGRWFNIPLRKLQHPTAREDPEEVEQEYATATLLPQCERFEQAYQLSLLSPQERKVYFVEHNMDVLLRPKTLVRYQAYAIARQQGILNTDEIRAKENMDPIGEANGGDVYLAPMNMVPLKTLVGAMPTSTTANPTPTNGSGPPSGDQKGNPGGNPHVSD